MSSRSIPALQIKRRFSFWNIRAARIPHRRGKKRMPHRRVLISAHLCHRRWESRCPSPPLIIDTQTHTQTNTCIYIWQPAMSNTGLSLSSSGNPQIWVCFPWFLSTSIYVWCLVVVPWHWDFTKTTRARSSGISHIHEPRTRAASTKLTTWFWAPWLLLLLHLSVDYVGYDPFSAFKPRITN